MSRYYKTKGFSLIELLISLGIVGVLLTVIVLNQRSYTEAAIISNTVDNLGLTISQAQTYGVAVKVSPGTQDFSSAYGISMNLGSGLNNAFLFFADRNNNQYYDGSWTCTVGGTSECLEKVTFAGGNYIESFCMLRSSGNSNICTNVSRLDVSFRRPDTSAQLKFFNSGGSEFNPANVIGGRIILRSPGGLTRSVTIYNTGQISIQ